jgi:hypothetical protein
MLYASPLEHLLPCLGVSRVWISGIVVSLWLWLIHGAGRVRDPDLLITKIGHGRSFVHGRKRDARVGRLERLGIVFGTLGVRIVKVTHVLAVTTGGVGIGLCGIVLGVTTATIGIGGLSGIVWLARVSCHACR